MRKQVCVAVASLLLFAIAGCGGSSNRSAGYGAFISQVNKLCAQADAAVAQASGTQAQLAQIDTFVNKIKAQTPPDQLKPLYDQLTSIVQQERDALKAGDQATAKSLGAQADQIATKIGLGTCAKSSS